MAVRKHFRELDLVESGLCSMRRPDLVHYDRLSETVILEEAVRKVLLTGMVAEDRRVHNLGQLIEEAWPNVEAARVTKTRFREFLSKKGLRLANRLKQLLKEFQVFQPVTPYTLSFTRALVNGSYAVLARAGEQHPDLLWVLRIRGASPRAAFRKMPDAVNYCRWLHLVTHDAKGHEVRVLNFNFEAEEAWEDRVVEESVVRSSVTSLIEYILVNSTHPMAGVPVPGAHCSTCRTDGCVRMEAC